MTAWTVVPGSVDLVWVEGPDAASFLQGLLTNDVDALTPGADCRALLLDATGHVQADVRVARTAEAEFTLITAPGAGDALATTLDDFHFSEDVTVLGPEPSATLTVLDHPQAPDVAADLVVRGVVPATWDLVGDDLAGLGGSSGARTADPIELERRRIEAGVLRFGTDYGPANLVQEAGLDDVAVSFDKGCYLGQETVARLRFRGRANRAPRGLVLPAAANTGSDVRLAGRSVGTLTSTTVSPTFGSIGLAILRREVSVGDMVDVDGVEGPAEVVALPFSR